MKRLAFIVVLLAAGAWAQNKHTVPALDTNNVFTGTNQLTLGDILGPQTFASLSGSAADGSQTYCTDCQVLNPCQSGGLGAFAQKVNGTWQCGGSGGGGTPGGANTQIQFNNSGFFAGSPNLTWSSPVLTIGQASTTTGELGLASSAGGTIILVPSGGGGTATLPGNTGTLAETNLAQQWTAAQTFDDLLVSNGTQTATLSLATLGANRTYTIPDSGGNNTFQMQAGATTAGDCVKFDANGNTIDAGVTCAGTNTPATPFGAIQFNNLGSFGGSAALTWLSPTLTIGQSGSVTGQLALGGATSGSVVITSSDVAGGMWTFRNASDIVVGQATADVFTNKTFDTSGSGNVFKVAATTITGKQGTGGLIQLSTGTPVAGDCVKFDTNLNTVDAGQPCATANAAGSATQVQFNSNGSALGASPALTFSSPTLTVGQTGVSTGILALAGATSGTTSLTTATTASGTWTLRATTDNVVGAATTDTLTNKTFDTAGTGNVFKINGTQVSGVTGTGSTAVLATSPTIGTSLTIGGTASQLVFNGNTHATTISVGNPAAARTYTLPDSGGNNTIALTAGALTTGDCAKFDASGNVVDAGAACGTSSPGGLTTQVQFNSAGSFAGSANLTWVSPTLTIGSNGAATGVLALAGATSGSVSITTVAAAGGTATFPNATGTVLEGSSSLTSGQLAVASGAATLNGSVNLTWSSPTLTIGVAGATTGQLSLANATSGAITLVPASGGGTLTLPSGTLTLMGATGAITTNALPRATGSFSFTSSALSDNATLLSATEGLAIAPTSTTQVALKVTVPAASTSDALDILGLVSTTSFNASGELVLPVATAVQNGGSFILPAGNCPSPATAGEWCYDGTFVQWFDGSQFQKVVASGLHNVLTNENDFNQASSTTPVSIITAASGFGSALGGQGLIQFNNNSGTAEMVLGCQTTDAKCPGAFGIWTAGGMATIGATGTAGIEGFAAGTDPGVLANMVSWVGPATLTGTGYNLELPGVEPVGGQLLAVSGTVGAACTSHKCASNYPATLSSDSSGNFTANTVSITPSANGVTLLSGKRFTDTAPTGWFFSFTDTLGTQLASLDINGNLTVTSCAGCGASNIQNAPQFQIPYYSAAGTSNTLSGDSNFTVNSANTQLSWAGSLGVQSPAFTANGTTNGELVLTATGTAGPAVPANSFMMQVPTGVTAWTLTVASAAATGIPHYSNSSGTVTESIGTIGSADLAATNKTRTCAIILGDESGSALTTGNIEPQKSQCLADVAMTVTQILVMVDAGASTVQLGYRHSTGAAPTVTNYTAAVMTPATVTNITDHVVCANAGGTAITVDGVSVTCGTLATQTWNAGDLIETAGGTADATTKRMSIFVTATVN